MILAILLFFFLFGSLFGGDFGLLVHQVLLSFTGFQHFLLSGKSLWGSGSCDQPTPHKILLVELNDCANIRCHVKNNMRDPYLAPVRCKWQTAHSKSPRNVVARTRPPH